MESTPLSPRRPYLLRAFYHWLLDNQLTPHIVVNVTLPGVRVPMEYANGGQIVLNIAPRAVQNLEMTNELVRFNARFGGQPRQVTVPMAAVLAIYSRENGAGTLFEQESAYLHADKTLAESSDGTVTPLISIIKSNPPSAEDDDDPPPPPPRGGRPKLRVIK